MVVRKNDPDDCIAAALLALWSGNAPAAEKHLERAKALGASVTRYLDPLAAAAFKDAEERLKKKRPNETLAALSHLKTRYGKTPWYRSHRADVEVLERRARAMIAEAEAEKLYAQAAALYQKKELFDLKPIIEKLKNDYPETGPVTDATRKPSFAEMAGSVAKLGKFITVRQDGKGDFKSIQAAIDAAPPNSLIEIQDDGPYFEQVLIPKEKTGITLRGKRGCWPLIRSGRPIGTVRHLLTVSGVRHVRLDRVVVAHESSPGGLAAAVFVRGSRRFRLSKSILWNPRDNALRREGTDIEVSTCLVLGEGGNHGAAPLTCTDTIWIGHAPTGRAVRCIFRNCVLRGLPHGLGPMSVANQCALLCGVLFQAGEGRLMDSVVLGQVESSQPDVLVEYCAVTGTPPFIGKVRRGRGCISADPQFRDPANLDYRLKPTSLCRKRASDGGDLGCRYTKEMLEVLAKALELRKKGIIEF